MIPLQHLQNPGMWIYKRRNAYSNWLWLNVYWNRMSVKICISFANVDFMYCCFHDFYETIINLLNVLSCVHLNNMPWFCKIFKREQNICPEGGGGKQYKSPVGNQVVGGSIPVGDIYFHFNFFSRYF